MRLYRCHQISCVHLSASSCGRSAVLTRAIAEPGARSSDGWQAEGQDGYDRLHNLGRAQNYNINVDHGQSAEYLDPLFTGNFLGKKSDIASGELRYNEFRTYNNIQGDYYIAQRFLHRVAMHMAKNYLSHKLKGVKVPLILGIWGPKGTGKTFQTELSFKKMKAQPVIMSAGELESGTAGGPGYLIRKRYRAAADMSKVRGVMSCLMVNDLDAGLGRFESTGATVNNQIVCSTLMNICDDPQHVSLGLKEMWGKPQKNIRIPIIVTGNDFSTLWAPLIRDGRMDKFYWEPHLEEKAHMVHQMYKDDGITFEQVVALLHRFGNQPLDFFGAIRANTYDHQILAWIRKEVAVTDLDKNFDLSGLADRLMRKDDLPEFKPQQLDIDGLMEQGDRIVQEHELVNSMRLSDEYMNKGNPDGKVVTPMIGLAM